MTEPGTVTWPSRAGSCSQLGEPSAVGIEVGGAQVAQEQETEEDQNDAKEMVDGRVTHCPNPQEITVNHSNVVKSVTAIGAAILGHLIAAPLHSLTAEPQVQLDAGFPLIVEEISIVGSEHDLGIVADAALGPGGSV